MGDTLLRAHALCGQDGPHKAFFEVATADWHTMLTWCNRLSSLLCVQTSRLIAIMPFEVHKVELQPVHLTI